MIVIVLLKLIEWLKFVIIKIYGVYVGRVIPNYTTVQNPPSL